MTNKDTTEVNLNEKKVIEEVDPIIKNFVNENNKLTKYIVLK